MPLKQAQRELQQEKQVPEERIWQQQDDFPKQEVSRGSER